MRLAIGFTSRKFIAAAAVAAALAFTNPASAQNKVALIIGNGTYQNVTELTNPPHDAADVAAAFKRLGFSVQLVTNASYEDMRRSLLKFSGRARNAQMAVVFFAGHGMEMGGENWLIPTDAELKTDLDVDQEAIALHAIMLMASTASKLGLVVLDACRNNPFLGKMKRTIATRSLSRGLSRIDPVSNVLVAYSAKDGTTAIDGDGRNSPFTTALLKYLEVPGLEINFLFRDVRDDVIASTRGDQEPFVYGSLSKEAIYFKPPTAPAASAADAATWSFLKETTDVGALSRFVVHYPDSPLRKDAEARIAALEAAEAAKPVPPRPDEVTWVLLKDTTDEAALKHFLGQYPTSKLRKDAEARIAALEAAQAAKPKPPGPDQVSWVLLKETTDEAALKRFAGQYPNSPLRKDAEARIAALQAAQAAKPIPPRADEAAWALIKNTTDEDALKRFATQYPDSPLRKDAQSRIASLETAPKSAPASAVDPHELARSLQFELKRVGCFGGAVNGEFDDATKAAWRSFGKHASITLPDGLSSEAIKAVRAFDKRICPLVCPDGERSDGNRCVVTQQPSHAAAPAKRQSNHAAAPAKRQSSQPAVAQKRCKTVGFMHNTWCLGPNGWTVQN